MSADDPKSKKVQIETSALTNKPKESNITEAKDGNSDGSVGSDAPAPWSKDEPLTKIHSLLGHHAQGDVYRNDLELVYDRLTGDAEAPEFVPLPEEDQEEAFEELPSQKSDFDDFDIDAFSFSMSAGEVSVETVDHIAEEAIPNAYDQTNDDSSANPNTIFGEVSIDEFDRLHKTAKTSPSLTGQEVEAKLKSDFDVGQVDEDKLEQLAGGISPDAIASHTENEEQVESQENDFDLEGEDTQLTEFLAADDTIVED